MINEKKFYNPRGKCKCPERHTSQKNKNENPKYRVDDTKQVLNSNATKQGAHSYNSPLHHCPSIQRERPTDNTIRKKNRYSIVYFLLNFSFQVFFFFHSNKREERVHLSNKKWWNQNKRTKKPGKRGWRRTRREWKSSTSQSSLKVSFPSHLQWVHTVNAFTREFFLFNGFFFFCSMFMERLCGN